MQEKITQRIEKTREQISTWRKDRINELQETQETLKGHRENIEARRDELVKQGSDALYAGRGTLRSLEANALDSAREFLSWASENLGPRADFLTRGESALEEALVSLRAGHSATLPIAEFDTLAVKKVVPELKGLSHNELRTLHAYESKNKNRKTLLREIDERVENTMGDETVA